MFGNFFKKKQIDDVENNIDTSSETNTVNMDLDTQIDWLKENNWCESYDKNKRTILIMDDREEIISSVIDDLTSLNEMDSFNLEDFNILTVSSKMAGFSVLDILEKAKDIEIHFALLDIILGGKKVINGKRKMVDGVDVAVAIWTNFPSTDILFFSGCIIEDNDDPLSFKNRFYNYTKDDMSKYIMPKDTAFNEELDKLSSFFSGF